MKKFFKWVFNKTKDKANSNYLIEDNAWIVPITGQLIIRGSGALLQFSFFFMLARMVGSEGFGIFSLSYSIILIGSALSRWGMDQIVLKELSVLSISNDLGNRREKIFWIGIVVIFCVSVLVVGLVVILLKTMGAIFKDDGTYGSMIGVLIYAITPQAIIQYLGECFRTKKMHTMASFIQTVATPAVMTVMIATTIIHPKSLNWIASCFVYGSWVLCILSLFLWLRLGNVAIKFVKKIRLYEIKGMLRSATPIATAGIMTTWLGFSELIFLGAIQSAEDVALYAASVRLMFLFGFVVLIINNILSPKIAIAYELKKFKEISSLLKKAACTGAAITFPIFLLLMVFPGHILGVFGEEFRSGSTSLQIIAFGQLLLCVTGGLGATLLMTGNGNAYRSIVIVGVLINLFISPVMIHLYGANGAAASATISILILNSMFLVKVIKIFR
jgi:O-antigen/teichoic acid export membrane protein